MSTAAMRRLLFITYYFPPSSGPGVQRVLKFVKYLGDYGWQPTVLTVRPEDAAFPNIDDALSAEIPDAIDVVRTQAWDPYALYARLQGKDKSETVGVGFVGESTLTWKQHMARWVRANIFLPDARVGWVPYAKRAAEQLVKEQTFDAVFSSGPPHSTHLIGYHIAQRQDLPWMADFRDPWTGIDYISELPMSALAKGWDARLEKKVLQRANRVLTVSPDMKRRLEAHVRARYEVVENGFDPADFEEQPPPLLSRFTLSYIGNLNAARNPEALWKALTLEQTQACRNDLRIRLIGNVDPVALASAEQSGVAGNIIQGDYRPHAEAIHAMRESALLLLVINRVEGAEGIMTGKLYEYIASGRPVLAIGPPKGDAAAVLQATGAGQMFDYDDTVGVAGFLAEHYAAWQAGEPKAGASLEQQAPYSRYVQTGQVAALLNEITRS